MIGRLLAADWPWRRIVVVSLLAHAALLLAAVRHAFFWGGSLAPLLHMAEALGLLLFAGAAGLALLQALRRADERSEAFLLRVGIALSALAMLAPPFTSADLWDYLARGRVDVLGFNPYVTTVESLRSDPAMAAFTTNARWPEWVMPYGPLAAALQFLCALPDSPWVGAYLWKACTTVAHVLTGVVVLQALRLPLDPTAATDPAAAAARERSARRGMVLWLWNPWLLLETCGAGHNDALVALFLVVCCHAVLRRGFGTAALTYGTAMLIKHGSPPLAPLLLITAVRQRRLLAFAAGTAAVLAVVAVAWLQYWNVPGGLEWITNQGSVARGSLMSLAGLAIGRWGRWLVLGTGLLTVAALLLTALVRVRDARTLGRLGALVMLVFLLLCVPNFAVWYHLWWLPLLVLARAPELDRVLLWLAFAGPLVYLVHAATHAYGIVHEVWGFLLGNAVPLALVLAGAHGVLRAAPGAPDANSSPA